MRSLGSDVVHLTFFAPCSLLTASLNDFACGKFIIVTHLNTLSSATVFKCNIDALVNLCYGIITTDEIILDYSEAQSKLKEDENMRRVEEGLTVGLTKEVSCCKLYQLRCSSTLIDLSYHRNRTKKSLMPKKTNTKT